MSKHIADQPRERAVGTRAREFARVERERGSGGPHRATRDLQRRAADAPLGDRRVEEFLRRDRQQNR